MEKRTISTSKAIECRHQDSDIECTVQLEDGSKDRIASVDKVFVNEGPLTRKIRNQGSIELDTQDSDIEILESESYVEVNVVV